MKTKAAILVEPNQPLWITDGIEVPEPEYGQVMVQVNYTGICGSQIMEITGRRGRDPWLPHMLGHEASGVVVKTGEGVTRVRSGDDVILSWIKGPGLDVQGTKYQHDGKIINSGPVTTFSEYTLVSENRCTKITGDIPANVSALLGCAVLTGFGAVNNFIGETKDGNIAIFGLGGIGLSGLMAARYHNLHTIIAVDVMQDKLNLAGELGATHLVDASRQDAVEYIRQLTGGGVGFSFEASGSTDVIEDAFNSVRKNGGICVFAGHPPHDGKICLNPFDLISGKKIFGTWGGESRPEQDIPFLEGLYARGQLPLDRLISRTFNLDNINQAIAEMQRGSPGRILVKM